MPRTTEEQSRKAMHLRIGVSILTATLKERCWNERCRTQIDEANRNTAQAALLHYGSADEEISRLAVRGRQMHHRIRSLSMTGLQRTYGEVKREKRLDGSPIRHHRRQAPICRLLLAQRIGRRLHDSDVLFPYASEK